MEPDKLDVSETVELIQDSFNDIIKVLDEFIDDDELKKQTFKEMQDNFNQMTGGLT